MSEIEFITPKPVVDCFNIIKNLKDIKYDLTYIRIEKTKYFNCEFEIFEIVSCAFADVVFENCVIENLSIKHDIILKNVKFINCKIVQLFISESYIRNIKFINCEINEIILIDCDIDIPTLKEFSQFKKVVYNHCILNILRTSIFKKDDLFDELKSQNIYLMDCYHSINLNHANINNIGKSDFQIIVENINILTTIIIIGCKNKNITQWDHWFKHSTEEYDTPRNTEKFEKIKSDYYHFRNETLKIIENLKKGLN